MRERGRGALKVMGQEMASGGAAHGKQGRNGAFPMKSCFHPFHSKVGGTPICSQVSRLLVSAGADCWEPMPNMLVPRAHAGVTSSGGCVFVLGGRAQVGWLVLAG